MPDRKDIRLAMREAAEGAGGVRWHAGHLADDSHSCNCPYVFDEGCMGGIAEVYVDNGIASIEDGANDCPPEAAAKANLRHIALSCPANVIAAFDAFEEEIAELKRELASKA